MDHNRSDPAGRLRIGITLPQIGGSFGDLVATAERARAAGLDGVFLFDHLWPAGARHRAILECWTTLAALTARVEQIAVGTLVTRLSPRHPALLAKMAATVDRIGGGRLILGLGTGDDFNQVEDRAYGLTPFVPADRPIALREAVTVIDRLWREPTASFGGEHFRIERATLEPKPVQRPRPPIWIGGNRPAARRIAAELADGWNAWGIPPAEFAAGVAELRRAAQAAGRKPGAVEPTWAGAVFVGRTAAEVVAARERHPPRPDRPAAYRGWIVAGHPAECREQLAAFAAAGATWLIADLAGPDKSAALDRLLTDVLPGLHR